MHQRISDFFRKKFEGHQVLILGYGREGKSTYKFIRALFPEAPLSLADLNIDIVNNKEIESDDFLDYYLGDNYLDSILNCDLIIKSPGISLKDINLPKGIVISSQSDLFVELFREQIIGVTGTKGKSTTVSLIKHILENAGKEVFLLGNIGKPAFDSIPSITHESIVVLEMSSHQLEYCSSSPKYSILLNLFQEHLDHYKSYEHYQDAKMNIAKWQGAGDVLFYCKDNLALDEKIEALISYGDLISYGEDKEANIHYNNVKSQIEFRGQIIKIDKEKFLLKGNHNISNLLAVIGVLSELGLTSELILKYAYTFKGLPHRMEYVGCFKGIHFYNDSIATIPEASLLAIKSLDKVTTLIIGGYDRGIDYKAYLEWLAASSIENIILVGELQVDFYQTLEPNFKGVIRNVGDMKEVVAACFELNRDNSICLLSPAASSYDQYRNFEDRGDQFKELIRSY